MNKILFVIIIALLGSGTLQKIIEGNIDVAQLNSVSSVLTANKFDFDEYLSFSDGFKYFHFNSQWYRIILYSPPVINKVNLDFKYNDNGYITVETNDGYRYVYIKNLMNEIDTKSKSIPLDERVYLEKDIHSIEIIKPYNTIWNFRDINLMEYLIADRDGIFINEDVIPIFITDKNPTIKVNISGCTSLLYILNGYVDVNNKDAYKDYSRLKKVKIITNGKEEILEFNDFVEFKIIQLRDPLENENMMPYILIEVLEIFEGETSSDICITSLDTGCIDPSDRRETELIDSLKELIQNF